MVKELLNKISRPNEKINDTEEDKFNSSKKVEKTNENYEIENMNLCLIDELSKLKESSKEAVEGLNFSEFKKYIHIERNVQNDLEKLIEKAFESDKSQLILVCGSVGDGKSHIISYFKDKYAEKISKFKIHNDATESLEPNKTSVDTLNLVLDEFSDGKINISKEKMILAINLGTLNNFIDSEYSYRFTTLKKFVIENKILESTINKNEFDENSNIQFVNFCDYHLYTIKNGEAKSDYIKNLIKKLTDKKDENYFYESYKKNCINCENSCKCPIKSNYEFLSLDNVQNNIIDFLIQAMVKNKILISTRSLLNFMYDILVARSYIDVNSPTFKKKIGNLKPEEYIKSLTPNILFGHKDLSNILKSLNLLDPLNIRTKESDDFIIEFNNSINNISFFDEYMNLPKGYIDPIKEMDFDGSQGLSKLRPELIKLFIRSYVLCAEEDKLSLKDEVYIEYIKNIYYWNKGEKNKLLDVYKFVKSGILMWNGKADKEHINIFIGKNQNKYIVSEKINFKSDLGNLKEVNDEELTRFLNFMRMYFKSDNLEKAESIDIDYSLYKLLKEINSGYRPNKKDRNEFVNFIEFIKKIENVGSQDKNLVFTEKNREENKKYKLEYDDEFEIYKFMEI